ncbi:proprotein convertase P-domain-containing protein [Streptomyces pimonensis]|uniref:Proprotein convertase P-domain-containing protein n=1 Tax=Streptomyces pimonensis TaxID=2860288 RepID=A0ABV4IX15_9ACTN
MLRWAWVSWGTAVDSTGQPNAWSLGLPSHENPDSRADPGRRLREQIRAAVTGPTGTGSARTQVDVHVEQADLVHLKIGLVAPDGSLTLLKGSGSPGEGGVIKKVYTVDTSGMWKLRVDDVMPGSTGTVHDFVLRFWPSRYPWGRSARYAPRGRSRARGRRSGQTANHTFSMRSSPTSYRATAVRTSPPMNPVTTSWSITSRPWTTRETSSACRSGLLSKRVAYRSRNAGPERSVITSPDGKACTGTSST